MTFTNNPAELLMQQTPYPRAWDLFEKLPDLELGCDRHELPANAAPREVIAAEARGLVPECCAAAIRAGIPHWRETLISLRDELDAQFVEWGQYGAPSKIRKAAATVVKRQVEARLTEIKRIGGAAWSEGISIGKSKAATLASIDERLSRIEIALGLEPATEPKS